MGVTTQTLNWFPEGALFKRVLKGLCHHGSIKQGIADETPEEVLEELRLLFCEHSRAALSVQPIVRVLLVGSDKKQIKPLSAILRWLRGAQRARLSEYHADKDSLPLFIDFVAKPGEARCGMHASTGPSSYWATGSCYFRSSLNRSWIDIPKHNKLEQGLPGCW